MVESGPTSVIKKATSKASTTARASLLCAWLGDKLERMKCCSSGRTAAVFTIERLLAAAGTSGTKLIRLRHSRHELPQFAAISAHGPADDEQGSVAAFERAGLARFPAAAHVIAPVTDLGTLFRSTVPALPGPIGHPA